MYEPYVFDNARRYVMRADIRHALDEYAERGIPVGDFLEAVLTNNFMGAVGRADDDNLENLPAVACYIYNEMPMACHGSKERYHAWLERHRHAETVHGEEP